MRAVSKKPDLVYWVFVIAFPFLILAGIGIEILFFRHLFLRSEVQSEVLFYQEAILLNGSHIFLGLFFLFTNDTGFTWLKSNWEIAARFLGISLFFGLLHHFAANPYFNATLILAIILKIASVHHAFAQKRGIWILGSIGESQIKLRKRITNFLMVAFLAFYVAFKFWNWPNWLLVASGCIVLGAPLIALLRAGTSKADLLYAARFIVPFAFPFSNLSRYGMGSVHGMEYVWVLFKQEQMSRLPVLKISGQILVSIFLCTLFIAPGRIPQIGDFSTAFFRSSVSLSVIFGLTFGHYFLDFQFFSNRLGQKNLAIRSLLRINDVAHNESNSGINLTEAPADALLPVQPRHAQPQSYGQM